MEEELPLVISSSFSNLCVEVLDVNFINHYKTSGFLFFNDKEDAKKTDNSVVKVKGCLIQDYFKLLSVRKLIQVRDAIPWVRCASGNVWNCICNNKILFIIPILITN